MRETRRQSAYTSFFQSRASRAFATRELTFRKHGIKVLIILLLAPLGHDATERYIKRVSKDNLGDPLGMIGKVVVVRRQPQEDIAVAVGQPRDRGDLQRPQLGGVGHAREHVVVDHDRGRRAHDVVAGLEAAPRHQPLAFAGDVLDAPQRAAAAARVEGRQVVLCSPFFRQRGKGCGLGNGYGPLRRRHDADAAPRGESRVRVYAVRPRAVGRARVGDGPEPRCLFLNGGLVLLDRRSRRQGVCSSIFGAVLTTNVFVLLAGVVVVIDTTQTAPSTIVCALQEQVVGPAEAVIVLCGTCECVVLCRPCATARGV